MTPLKERMNRQMPSTPRNQHRPPHEQKGQGYYQDDDYAIAHGTRRSAKDGSVYMQKTQQEDPTKELVQGLRTTQKAKRSLQHQGAAISSNERSPMPYNTGTLNNLSPTNRRAKQPQGM
ncbi:hypothetical protein EC957_011756, partial [Mortierella hygrophila]